MENKTLVASWGYSMILTTWVKVIKVSPKSLLVQEIKSRAATEVELAGRRPGFLQSYTMPMEVPEQRNGEDAKPFRLYKAKKTKAAGGGIADIEGWFGKPTGMGTRIYFKLWDGKPQFEDHCD